MLVVCLSSGDEKFLQLCMSVGNVMEGSGNPVQFS